MGENATPSRAPRASGKAPFLHPPLRLLSTFSHLCTLEHLGLEPFKQPQLIPSLVDALMVFAPQSGGSQLALPPSDIVAEIELDASLALAFLPFAPSSTLPTTAHFEQYYCSILHSATNILFCFASASNLTPLPQCPNPPQPATTPLRPRPL